MSLTPCPDCGGDGQSPAMHTNTTGDFRYAPCHTCRGRGQIHELHLAAIEREIDAFTNPARVQCEEHGEKKP